MPELDEEAQLLLSLYLKAHRPAPVRGAGCVRLEFQEMPATRPAAFEPLLQDVAGAAWYLRWPNGTLRWVTEQHLTDRGFPVPQQPLVAALLAHGAVQPYWHPAFAHESE